MLLSSERSNEGNSKRFESIASKSVAETNAPRATVPPKFDTIKTEKPKKRTTEV